MNTEQPRHIAAQFVVSTIGNGYLVRHMSGPSRSDPLGQRESVLYVAEPDKVGAAVGQHMARIVAEMDAPSLIDQAFRRLRGEEEQGPS